MFACHELQMLLVCMFQEKRKLQHQHEAENAMYEHVLSFLAPKGLSTWSLDHSPIPTPSVKLCLKIVSVNT